VPVSGGQFLAFLSVGRGFWAPGLCSLFSNFRFWGGETGSTVAGDRFGPDRGAGSTGLSYFGWLEAGAGDLLPGLTSSPGGMSPYNGRLVTPLLRIPCLGTGSTNNEAGRSKIPTLRDLYP
jgi:hypothetical protein